MSMTRKDFIKTTAGAAAMAAIPASGSAMAASNAQPVGNKGKPKLGVSIYSYHKCIGKCMTLEDFFADLYDLGADYFALFPHNIENYPNPSTKWIDYFFGLCEKYQVLPDELEIVVEENVKRGPMMTDEEYLRYAVRDLKLANLLGFTCTRSRFVDINGPGTGPTPGWQGRIAKLLPYAEKYNIVMQPEIKPFIKDKWVYDYINEIILKYNTKYFGFNVDFSSFMLPNPDRGDLNNPPPNFWEPVKPAALDIYKPPPQPQSASAARTPTDKTAPPRSLPEDIIPLLPYIHTCHAKFYNFNENFEETTEYYKEVLTIFRDNNNAVNLLSEYEGPHMDNRQHVADQLRRQHIMQRKFFGITTKKGGMIND